MRGGDNMELGSQIKKYRAELALSHDALAEKVYVSRQTISESFSGIRCGCDHLNYCNFVWFTLKVNWFGLCDIAD